MEEERATGRGLSGFGVEGKLGGTRVDGEERVGEIKGGSPMQKKDFIVLAFNILLIF